MAFIHLWSRHIYSPFVTCSRLDSTRSGLSFSRFYLIVLPQLLSPRWQHTLVTLGMIWLTILPNEEQLMASCGHSHFVTYLMSSSFLFMGTSALLKETCGHTSSCSLRFVFQLHGSTVGMFSTMFHIMTQLTGTLLSLISIVETFLAHL